MKKLLLLLALSLSAVCAHAQVINAASCSSTDVQTAFSAVVSATTTVNIPACSVTSWTTPVTLTIPSGSTTLSIIGAGSGATGGGDLTRIGDGVASSSAILQITTAGSTSKLRLSGITFQGAAGGTGNAKFNGIVSIGGLSQNVRTDHVHFDTTTYTSSTGSSELQYNGCIAGVTDHSIFDNPSGSVNNSIRAYNWGSCNGDSLGVGDQSWATPTNLGSSGFMFVEANTFNSGAANDCTSGGRYVWRFNTMNMSSPAPSVQTHPTGGGGRIRGCRAWEIYNNNFNANAGNYIDSLFFMSSGTGVVWGNAIPSSSAGGGTGYKQVISAHSMRTDNTTYTQTAPPAGWGYCGTNFNGTGSNWDQNSVTATGYHCMDQPGRGQGDLLTGGFTADGSGSNNVTNNATGCTSTASCAYPRQALEPVYEWADNYSPVPSNPSFVFSVGTGNFVNNTDYYLWCDATSQTGCTSFTGATGTGSGVLASRPGTCTTGVAYWATDQGSWNTSGSGGQGVLYKCTATNTWTSSYTPYAYPHPLTTAQTNPSFGSYCTGGNGCTLTSVAGATVLWQEANFNTGGSAATLNTAAVPVFVSYPTIWDAGTATSTAWAAFNVSSGSNTVAVTNAGGDHFNTTQAISITGTATVNPIEYVHSSVTGTSATCTSTVTTTHPNDLIVSFINAAGSAVISLGSSTQSMTLASGAGGNVGAAYGVVPSAGTANVVWSITGGGQWVCDTFALKPNPGTPPTVSSVAVTPVSPSVVANAHITLGATATYSDGGLQDVSGAASTWASSIPAVALISTVGIVNPASAGTTNVTATYSSVTSPNDVVTVTPYTPVNWYVRPAGGTRFSSNVTSGQCDGLGDADYPGTGTNRHCAFNDVRFLWQDGSAPTYGSFPAGGWVIASSDIVTIRGSIADGVSYRIGYPANNDPSTGGGYPFFGISGDVGDSGMTDPPPGSVSQPTIIQGGNAGSCHAQSARTQIFGQWGIGHIIDATATNNVTFSCLDLTDASACGTLGVGIPLCKSGTTVLANYAVSGIHLSNTSTNIHLNDMRIHGLLAGLAGPSADGFIADHVELVGNQNSGWNADDGGPSGLGSALITNFDISWNGCIEEYPIVDALPYIYCRDQGTGGYGDGFGTASLNSTSPGWQVHFDNGTASYNTQDGLDALHIGGPGSTMTESRVLAFGNEGQQLKIGGATGHIFNNKIFGNCDALAKTTLVPPGAGTYGSQVVSNVATFLTSNVFAAGDTLVFSGLTNISSLNGTTAVVSATGLSNSQFSVPFTHVDIAFAVESGNATYPIPGRPINTFDSLSNVCRAGNQAIFATVSPGFTTSIQFNTIYTNGQIGMEIEYADSGNKGSTNVAQYNNNVFIGFPANPYANPGTTPNPIFSNDNLNMFTNPGGSWSNNSYLNAGHGWACPNPSETADLCTTPGLVNQTMPPLSTVNVTPASGASAAVGAGVAVSGITTDFAGVTRPNPPSIGALEFAAGPPTVATPTASPAAGTYTSTQSVTLTTVTAGATICYTTNGTTPGAATAGTCDVGSTTYSGAITVATTTTIKAIGTLSGDSNSSVFSGLYTITPPVTPNFTGFGNITVFGNWKMQ